MATNYNSRHTGAQIDNAVDYAIGVQLKMPNIGTTTPNSGDVLTWYQNAYRPRPPAIPNLTTDNIVFAYPSNSNTSMAANQPLTNIVNAVNNKLDKNGNGSQVNVSANALYSNDLQLNQTYTLAQLVGYLCNKQNNPLSHTTTHKESFNSGNNTISLPSGKIIKEIYIHFYLARASNGTSNISLIINGRTYTDVLVLGNSDKMGCIKIENNGRNWMLTVLDQPDDGTQSTCYGTPKIFMIKNTQSLNITSFSLNATRAITGLFDISFFYN